MDANVVMQAMIPPRNRAIFLRAVNALARVGDEVFVESQQNQLIFRAVNSSRSAFFCFTFTSAFFDNFVTKSASVCKCKLALKTMLSSLKSMPTSEQFWIQLSGGTECRLVFIFTTQEGRPEHGVTAHSPRGITKICRLTYEEAEPLRAIFTRDTPCVLCCEPKIFDLSTFVGVEEVVLSAEPEMMSLRSHVSEQQKHDVRSAIQTSINLRPSNFRTYQVPPDVVSEVIFALKDLRALMGFLIYLSQPVSIHFSKPGKPLLWSTATPEIQADFLLATVAIQEQPAGETPPAPPAS